MKIVAYLIMMIGFANLARSGVVPDDYRAQIIEQLLKSQKHGREGGWDYEIKFSPPAHALRGEKKEIVGAVRFIVLPVPPKNKAAIYNIGSFYQVAIFEKEGPPKIVSNVEWLFSEPKLDEGLPAVSIFAVEKSKGPSPFKCLLIKT